MKLARLFQPNKPIFWLMMALHALSGMLVWIVHHRPLNTFAVLIILIFAIGNALLGTWLAWRLVHDDS
jgi:4-hydroxybenzoate polyprenyltransferase